MLALIAGTGMLPLTLHKGLTAQGRAVLVCAMQGFAPEIAPHITFRLEELGSFLTTLRNQGVTDVCMAGAVRRPAIDPTAIDAATAPLIPTLQAAMAKGDDGALRGIIALFEDQGFRVIGAAELMPDLLPPAGILTATSPEGRHEADARIGDATLAELGAADQGQACLIAGGQVIAREGPEGTDAMLAPFCRPAAGAEADGIFFPVDLAGSLIAGAADWLTGDDTPAAGGILFKAPKPGQDRRADLPVVGPETAIRAAQAGLAGIVIEDGGVMVLDLRQVRAILDRHGLFLWVRAWD